MFLGEARRNRSSNWRQAAGNALDAYATRVMLGFILSLGILVATVHLPFAREGESVGWYVAAVEERLAVQHLEERSSQAPQHGIAATVGESNRPAEHHASASSSAAGDESVSPDHTPHKGSDVPHRLVGRKVLDYAQRMPQIVGGLGAYYIHIEYPEAAIREGVEGRLVLSFVVDTRGKTHQIEVIQPLHPACDSAAVQALRKTRFVPGSHDGEPVEVKMHLPVRFQLIPRPSEEISGLQG